MILDEDLVKDKRRRVRITGHYSKETKSLMDSCEINIRFPVFARESKKIDEAGWPILILDTGRTLSSKFFQFNYIN